MLGTILCQEGSKQQCSIDFGPMFDTDCYLRQGAHPAWQGAGGTEFARFGRELAF